MLKLLILAGLMMTMASSIYDFKVTSLDGGTIDFSKFKGKKILIVNTASQCGNTPQYAELEKLYKEHGKFTGDRWISSKQFWRTGTRL